MKTKFFNPINFILFFSVLFLIATGILFIYSAAINSEGECVSNEYIKQIIWAIIGIALVVFCAVFDYRFSKVYAAQLFATFCVILLFTRFFAKNVNGARSWIGIGGFGIQPSEFCKVVFIIFSAWFLERTQKQNEFQRFLFFCAIMFLPVALILLQPDLGTASVYIPIFLVMGFVAGIPLRYLGFFLFTAAFTIIFTILPLWQSYIIRSSVKFVEIFTNFRWRMLLIFSSFLIMILAVTAKKIFRTKKYYYWIAYTFLILTIALVLSFAAGKVLKDYQIKRLIVFLDPNVDSRGAGYHIIQSKIAIGAGSFFGRGFLKGTQSHYRFLPQQSTDFIFSIFAEESGFVGGLFVFFLYALIFFCILCIMKKANSLYGYYIASGIFGMFLFHFMINVGMVMGIMPITGIPLLFMSYGGSSLWTAMICVGILISINSRLLDFSPLDRQMPFFESE